MIIQYLLTVGLLITLFYASTQGAKTPLVKLCISLMSVAGIYLVWFPEHANLIAVHMGVGRGTDLILYFWIVISLIVSLNLHLKNKKLADDMTGIVRHIAVQEAHTSELSTKE